MNFSDETVEKVAIKIASRYFKPDCLVFYSQEHIEDAKAALSSLTLADLMQVKEVRAVVEAGVNVFKWVEARDISSDEYLHNLHEKLTPFTETKQ